MGRCWLVGQCPKSLKGYVLSKRWSASLLSFTVMYLYLGGGWPRPSRFPIAGPMTCAFIQIGECSLIIIKQMPKDRGIENILDFSLAISCPDFFGDVSPLFSMTSWLCSYPQWFNSILGFSRLRCHFELGLDLIGNNQGSRVGRLCGGSLWIL